MTDLTEARLTESGEMRGLQAGANRVTQDYGVEPFVPSDIEGLIGWFDASDATTFSFDPTQPMEWRSKVGTALTGQADPTARPSFGTMPNGLAYLQMNPALDSGFFLGDTTAYDSPGFLVGTEVTICALIRKNGNNGWGRAISLHDASAGSDDWNNAGSLAIRSDGGGTNYFPSGDRNGSMPMTNAQNIGVWCNFAYVFTGSTCTLYNNGETFGPTSQSGTFSVDWISVGGRHGSDERLDCSVTEICIFDRVLTSGELTQVYDYFNSKWLDIEPTAPDAPVLVSATGHDTTIALDWTAPFDGNSAITDYIIEQSANGTTGWTVVTESVSTVTAYTVTGLTNDVELFFRVSAVNAIGTSPVSNVDSAIPHVSTGFTPTDLATLSLWLDPDDDDVFTFSTGTTVEIWSDKSANGYIPAQTDSTRRPLRDGTLNGRSTVVFDGSNDYLRHPTRDAPINGTDGSFTVFAVVVPAAGGEGRCIVDGDDNGGGTRIAQFLRLNNLGVESIIFSGGGNTSIGGGTVEVGVAYLLRVVCTGTVTKVFIESVEVASGTHSAADYTAGATLTIGGHSGSGDVTVFAGEMGEIIACSTDLSSPDIIDTEAYLRERWFPRSTWLYDSFPSVPAEFRWPGDAADQAAVDGFIQAADTSNYTRWDLVGASPPSTSAVLIISVEVEWLSTSGPPDIVFLFFANNTTGWSGTRNMVTVRQNGTSTIETDSGAYHPSEAHTATSLGLHRFDLYVNATTGDIRLYADDPGGTPFHSNTSYTDFRHGGSNHQVGLLIGGGSAKARVARWSVRAASAGYPE